MSQLRSVLNRLIARSIASVLAAIYGLGFVILGFHDATYGLAQFSPFGPGLFSSGLVFTALVIIAAASHHYGFQYLAALASVVSDTSAERRSHRDIVLTAGFIYSAGSIAMFLYFFSVSASCGKQACPSLAEYRDWSSRTRRLRNLCSCRQNISGKAVVGRFPFYPGIFVHTRRLPGASPINPRAISQQCFAVLRSM